MVQQFGEIAGPVAALATPAFEAAVENAPGWVSGQIRGIKATKRKFDPRIAFFDNKARKALKNTQETRGRIKRRAGDRKGRGASKKRLDQKIYFHTGVDRKLRNRSKQLSRQVLWNTRPRKYRAVNPYNPPVVKQTRTLSRPSSGGISKRRGIPRRPVFEFIRRRVQRYRRRRTYRRRRRWY